MKLINASFGNIKCSCKPRAGCYECCPDKIESPEWGTLVRNRQLDEIVEDLIRWKHKYYCEGSPEVSDARYDLYEEVIRRERPDHWILDAVGCTLCGGAHL